MAESQGHGSCTEWPVLDAGEHSTGTSPACAQQAGRQADKPTKPRQSVPAHVFAKCSPCTFWTPCGPKAHTYHLPSAFILLLELQMCGHLPGTRDTVWSQDTWPSAGKPHTRRHGQEPRGCRKTLGGGLGLPRWGLGQQCMSGVLPVLSAHERSYMWATEREGKLRPRGLKTSGVFRNLTSHPLNH